MHDYAGVLDGRSLPANVPSFHVVCEMNRTSFVANQNLCVCVCVCRECVREAKAKQVSSQANTVFVAFTHPVCGLSRQSSPCVYSGIW